MQCFLGVDRFTPIVPIRRDVGLVPGSIHTTGSLKCCNPTVQLSNQHDREQDKPLLSIMALLTHLHATMYGRKRCFSSVQRSRLTVLLHNSWSIASTSMLHFHDPVMREVSAIRVLVSTLVWFFLYYFICCIVVRQKNTQTCYLSEQCEFPGLIKELYIFVVVKTNIQHVEGRKENHVVS